MTMNIENLTRLKKFFEDGAPHFAFTMHLGLGPADDAYIQQDFEFYEGEEIPNSCGTAGCIAGAAIQILEKDPSLWQYSGWTRQWRRALELLGLEDDFDDPNGHPLFNPDLAPSPTTPADAARAIQNVIDGKDPWS